jgi:hypothetical protein
MPTTIPEPARNLPVTGTYDLVVAGGGMAGTAAAVAAARLGVSVCLLEKNCALGGLATLGNVTIWLPLCDGHGRQVIGGLGEELLKLSVADLGHDYPTARFCGIPACWQPNGDPAQRKTERYLTEFNPSSYLLALEKLVCSSNIKLLYDTRICAVRREADRVTHVIIENKSGRSAVACQTIVDATGDADICFLAGETIESLDSNVLVAWFYHLLNGELHLNQMSRHYSPQADKVDAKGPFFRGDDAEQVTAQIVQSRDMMRERLAAIRGKHPGTDVQIINPATIACFRMTRRLVGSFSLGEKNMHQWADDAVGLTGDWRKPGPVYTIPLRTLCGVKNRNLLVAGRCISADTTVWDATRAIPTCAVTGEAAGTAAALAVRHAQNDVTKLGVPQLQQQLTAQGVLLDPALVKAVD